MDRTFGPSTARPAGLALLASLAMGAACDRGERPAAPPPDPLAALEGTWRLDAETRAWLPRACVRLDFPDSTDARFVIERTGGDVVVRLDTPHRPTWRVRTQGRSAVGQQILPTTEAGRFCGSGTPVRLRLRETRPGVLSGAWETPGCDVCPDRPFGATRAGTPPLDR